jgi:DNA-binding FadR family transcriptional regulator
MRSLDEIVLQVRDAILRRSIQPGERLPSERDLCEQLGVSRTTVREALRALEAIGLVEIRLGAHGGAYARMPDAALLGQALSTLLLFQQASRDELDELRHSFEGDNAYWAALRATDEDLDELRTLAEQARRLRKGDEGWRALEQIDLAVHEAVARASHNKVRIAIMAGIHDALSRNLEELESLTSQFASVRKDITTTVELICARDAEGARDHMQRHLARWRKVASA